MTAFRSILRWCEIFGIELVDNDGFEIDVRNEVALEYFLNGISSCTIHPINKDRYAVLNDLLQ